MSVILEKAIYIAYASSLNIISENLRIFIIITSMKSNIKINTKLIKQNILVIKFLFYLMKV